MKNLILKFQPTSPVRETTLTNLLMALWQNGFQPTSPVRETTKYEHRNDGCNFISTHVPRAGDDVDVLIIHNFAFKFQPTSPVRETTRGSAPLGLQYIFQPTSPVRETTFLPRRILPDTAISTHVPRAGDDVEQESQWFRCIMISTHVPRAGDDNCLPGIDLT